MTAHPEPPALFAAERRDLGCYSGLHEATATVCTPATVDELRQVLRHAAETGRRVTLRAGGHAFDAQALGDDVVVSMTAFDDVRVLPDDRVEVGAGATWGAILAALGRKGLVPAVTVTTAHATAGGTLAGDCLSRFSCAYGKEGEQVESFEFLTVRGDLLHCTPPAVGSPDSSWTLPERVFMGAVGGLGYLGAIVRITYRVKRVPGAEDGIRVRTTVEECETYADLATDLIPITRKTAEEDSDPSRPDRHDAIYSAISPVPASEQTLLMTSHFTTEPVHRPMLLFRPRSLVRLPVEWAVRWRWFNRLLWRLAWRIDYGRGKPYVNELADFTFFVDGNARAKRVARALGFGEETIQQTFIVPSDPHAEGGWDQAQDDLVEWLKHTDATFRERGLAPTLTDVLFLPADLPFRLSATAALAGFAVSYAFETGDRDELRRIEATFSELADTLWAQFRGRVYLVKNVCADPATLAEMYGDNARAFFALKRELDPGCVLRNEFLERTFGDLLPPACAEGPP